MLDDGIHMPAYFHKDSDHWKILWWLKRIAMIGGYYDHWKELWWLEDIMTMEKDCDDWKRLW